MADSGTEHASLPVLVGPDTGLGFLGHAVVAIGQHLGGENPLYVVELAFGRRPTLRKILQNGMRFLTLGLGNRDLALGAVPLGVYAEKLRPSVFLTIFRFYVPVIGVHGAVQGDGGLASLVDSGQGIDELGVAFIGEAMVPHDEVGLVGPALFAEVRLALLFVHLEKDFPLHLQALTHALANDILLILVIVAATTGYDQALQGFFLFSRQESVAESKGENTGKQIKNISFHRIVCVNGKGWSPRNGGIKQTINLIHAPFGKQFLTRLKRFFS